MVITLFCKAFQYTAVIPTTQGWGREIKSIGLLTLQRDRGQPGLLWEALSEGKNKKIWSYHIRIQYLSCVRPWFSHQPRKKKSCKILIDMLFIGFQTSKIIHNC